MATLGPTRVLACLVIDHLMPNKAVTAAQRLGKRPEPV